jgi:hypothetical protein
MIDIVGQGFKYHIHPYFLTLIMGHIKFDRVTRNWELRRKHEALMFDLCTRTAR